MVEIKEFMRVWIELCTRFGVVWGLFWSIMFMPEFVGVPFFIADNGALLINMRALLNNGIIFYDLLILYGILPTIAGIWIIWDTLKWLYGGA